MTAAAQNDPADYAKSHWRQFETSEDHAERVERAELTAGWYFAEATKRQTEAHRRAMANLRGLVAPRYDRARAAAQAAWHHSTQEARDLYERTCDEIMREGDMSAALACEWDALCAKEAAAPFNVNPDGNLEHLRMNAPAPNPQPEAEPHFYHGTSFAVNEIILGMSVLGRKVRDLKQGNEAGSAVQQKLAAEEVAKIAGQIKMMADTITRVTIGHLNRRARP